MGMQVSPQRSVVWTLRRRHPRVCQTCSIVALIARHQPVFCLFNAELEETAATAIHFLSRRRRRARLLQCVSHRATLTRRWRNDDFKDDAQRHSTKTTFKYATGGPLKKAKIINTILVDFLQKTLPASYMTLSHLSHTYHSKCASAFLRGNPDFPGIIERIAGCYKLYLVKAMNTENWHNCQYFWFVIATGYEFS